MSNFETTELKLKTTPTGGAEAHVSPYYRRLVSAGYKGFLQGTIGGASLYGFLGLAVGTMASLALLPFATSGAMAGIWLLVPACAGYGVFKGASTFGNIGSVAAINAESADMSEQRRYLLDRYYDLPEGPEADREAEAIKRELQTRAAEHAPPAHMFHWKTVAVCAAIGAALVLTGLWASSLIGASATTSAAITFLQNIGIPLASDLGGKLIAAGVLAGAGGLVGALAGATIGLDRYYIRKWFDHTQDIIHPPTPMSHGLGERHRQVERLHEARKADEKTKAHMASLDAAATPPAATEPAPKTPAPEPKPVTSLDKPAATKPKNEVSKATLERRVKELEQLVEV